MGGPIYSTSLLDSLESSEDSDQQTGSGRPHCQGLLLVEEIQSGGIKRVGLGREESGSEARGKRTRVGCREREDQG